MSGVETGKGVTSEQESPRESFVEKEAYVDKVVVFFNRRSSNLRASFTEGLSKIGNLEYRRDQNPQDKESINSEIKSVREAVDRLSRMFRIYETLPLLLSPAARDAGLPPETLAILDAMLYNHVDESSDSNTVITFTVATWVNSLVK